MDMWNERQYQKGKRIMRRRDIDIYLSKTYGHNTYYIDSENYRIKSDQEAASFLELSQQDYRRLMRKSYKGFLAGDGHITFNTLEDASEASEVFEAMILAKTLGG